jgi:hypothetical protein
MKYVHAIILTLILITFFCCFFGYCLMRSCRRAIDLEFQEMNYLSDTEVRAGGGGSRESGSGSKNGGGKSKSGGAKSAETGGGGTKSNAAGGDAGGRWDAVNNNDNDGGGNDKWN